MHQMTSRPASLTYVVMTLWICTARITATTTPDTTATSSHVVEVNSDEQYCHTRYLSAGEGMEGAGQDAVGVAAVLELRRPQGVGCGLVSGTELQIAAALIWAARRLNGEGLGPGLGTFIPGVRIDLRVYDDCSQDLLAARHIGQLLSVHPDTNCTPATPPIAGVLGTTTSRTTTRVASLLAHTRIPHFGISATVSGLSDSKLYPTFFRTVPSDLTQSKVLVDLVTALQWTYVAGIYTKDNYGTEGFQEFKRLAALAGVCVMKEQAFWHLDDNIEDAMEYFVRELLIALGSTRFQSLGVVYFGHDNEAAILFQMIQDRGSKWHNQNKVERLHWLFTDGVGTSATVAAKAAPFTSKFISISAATTPLQDVREFFLEALDKPRSLGPAWHALATRYLRAQLGCVHDSAAVERCGLREKIEVYDYVPAALDALYSMAVLLSSAHAAACGTASGFCRNLSLAVEAGVLSLVRPQALNFSLHFSPQRLPRLYAAGRMLVPDEFGDFLPANSPLYFINSAANGRWTKIGEYSNSSLTFQPNADLSSVPRSECGTDCPECRQSDVIRYVYRPGDVILLGLYSVRSPAPGVSFSCGDYRGQSSTVAALLAFLRTINMLTSQSGNGSRPAGVKFGALVLDDCYNKLTASALITELFSGKTTLRDPVTKEVIDVSRVAAVVGSQSSSVTLSSLSVLTPLHIPTVSYSATSPDLDDRVSFPFFLRPVPSDSLQARALVDILHVLNVSYVGAMHQSNNYGLRGMQQFVKMAEEAGICVESPVPVDDGLSQIALLQALRDIRNKDAKVVVVFVLESTAIKLLDVLSGSNLGLIFLASEAWGVSTNTLHGQRGVTARGSLVLTVDSTKEAEDVGMADYFRGLTIPGVEASDLSWMRDFWEKELACNLAGGFVNAYGDTMCASDVSLGKDVAVELAADQKVVQTVNAVVSVVTALNQRCAHAPDPAACTLGLSAEEATRLIREVRLEDQQQRVFRPYLNNGNGNVGFTLHNVQKTAAGGYTYVQVGRYDPEGQLTVKVDDIVFYDLVGRATSAVLSTTCHYKLQCSSVCGPRPAPTPSPGAAARPLQSEEGSEGLIVGVVVLAVMCALLLALLLGMVCCARHRGRIPLVGVVKRGRAATSRTSRQGSSMTGGDFNVGFSPTSPRVSLPLPPVPRSSTAESMDRYDVTNDFGSGVNITRPSSAFTSLSGGSPTFPLPASPCGGGLGPQSQHIDAEDWQRRPRRHQFHPCPQMEEQKRQLDLLQQQQGGEPSPTQTVVNARDRPRASSVPLVHRPNCLSWQGQTISPSATDVGLAVPLDDRPKCPSWQRQATSPSATDVGLAGRGDGRSRSTLRPRSNSHDAAFRARLGAMSDDDQQVLMKYMSVARQPSPARSLQRPRTVVTLADVERVPTPSQRLAQSQIFMQSRMSRAEDADARSPNILFENPPSFCSSAASLCEATHDPSTLYLHAIAGESDLYLPVLPDPQHLPPTLPSGAGSPHGGIVPVAASLPPGQGAVSVAFTSGTLSTPATRKPSLVTSPMTPMTSVCGSSTSESSGAVFMSPDREHPPSGYSTPARLHPSDTGRVGAGVQDVATCSARQRSALSGEPLGAVGTVSSDVTPPVQSLEQNRMFSSDRPEQLIFSPNNNGSRNSSASEETPAEPSAPNASGFPAVVMSDSTGALYLLPHYLVPLQPHLQPAPSHAHIASGPVYPTSRPAYRVLSPSYRASSPAYPTPEPACPTSNPTSSPTYPTPSPACPTSSPAYLTSSPTSPPARQGVTSSGQQTRSTCDTDGNHQDTLAAGSAALSSPVHCAPCTSSAGDTKRSAQDSDLTGLGDVRRSNQPTLRVETRTPRMGVDSLSSPRKPAGNAFASQETVTDGNVSGSASTGAAARGLASEAAVTFTGGSARGLASGAAAVTFTGGSARGLASGAAMTRTSSSARNTSPKASASRCPETPSDSAPTSENPESGVSAPSDPLSRAESTPFIHGYQLLPAPAPCRATVPPADTCPSNHTSGDSGNGEDLNTEVENDTVTVMV